MRLVVIGPLPPPVHGVAVSTSLVLANERLHRRFTVEHLDTSDPRPGDTIGAWDATNLRLGLVHAGRLVRRLGPPKGIVYLPLSQSSGGFLRDSLFIRAARARGWRVAAHLRGGELDLLLARSNRPLRAWIRATLRRLTSIAVMGDSLRGLFDGLVAPDRIAVVPNGTPDGFAGVPTQPRERVVLFLSNLRERKGVLPAVDAAARVLARLDDVSFVFAGEWRTEALRLEVARRIDGEPRIRFVPPPSPEEKHRLMATSAAFLFPPVEPEGHPRVVIEAMSAGLPVVTTDRGAIAESVLDGTTGYVLAEPDPEALASRLIELLGDEELRARMAAASRQRFEEHFTQDRADRLLAEWLEGVAEAAR
jgi:glycosyltransferase involved in cell wall biosynthesis